ncbi:hypothetical protein BV22DRAFT_1192632 [Leucogyrophana mollusca]|uniref:Uncharacterized protein n=1 Tax=Leucogyrophana mollusca TaxID=85980 RepID=A0ACB8BV31_9AGAM|nr:hypothetical protein BV22DRAFT_1192632 [Leucogyrophana mollusca]
MTNDMGSESGWSNVSNTPSPVPSPPPSCGCKEDKIQIDSKAITPTLPPVPPPKKSLLYDEPVKHEEFYFPEGNAVLRAGDVVFKVHWSILSRHSKKFEKMSTAVNFGPIRLPLAIPAEFARLLTVLYHPLPSKLQKWTVEDWSSVINQAQHWGMQAIKSHAAKELNLLAMDPVAKIMLWRRYNLDPAQLIPSFGALCTSAEPLSLDILMKVGAGTFVKLVEAREKIREGGSRCCCAPHREKGELHSSSVEQIVSTILLPRS